MNFSGERYVPNLDWPDISYEHWHRYLWASAWVAGRNVLDVASGEGFGSALLARSAARVVGVDISQEAIDHARATYRASNLEFICGRAGEIPVAGRGVFDVVVSFETIEHLDEAEQRRFLADVQRLLRPDGVLLISTPDTVVYGARPVKNAFHLRELTRPEFEALLRSRFKHVTLLGQRVYPASYVWPLGAIPKITREYQLSFVDGCFVPSVGDAKCPMYLLAVCSDTPMTSSEASLLIDVSVGALSAARQRSASHANTSFFSRVRRFATKAWATVARSITFLHHRS